MINKKTIYGFIVAGTVDQTSFKSTT